MARKISTDSTRPAHVSKRGTKPSRGAKEAVVVRKTTPRQRDRQGSDKSILGNRLSELQQKDPHLSETRLSAWIRANKTLLVTAGAVTSGAAEALAWIVDHVDDITAFIHTVGSGLQSPAGRALDFDKLKIGQEPLIEALDNDPILTSAVIKGLMQRYDFDHVISTRVDLVGEGIYP
jgi:hypothetical protein